MNRAARRYLLDRLDAASRPLRIARLPEASPIFNDALADVIRGLGTRDFLILPPTAKIEIVKLKEAPRIVAGKGGRRRGVRDRVPPLRLFRTDGAASHRARLQTWSNLAAA